MIEGNWTVYCCDTFDGTRWQESFQTKEEALNYARRTGGKMLTCHVDDPDGKLIERCGSY